MKHNQLGMTLIEVLVTLLMVSIGLLGLASLQATSIKENMDTSKRSQGLWMVDELASRMRANPAGLATGYTTAGDVATLCAGAPKMCSDSFGGSAAGNCTANEMARYDVWEVICGHDNGQVISGANDNIRITNYTIACDAAPCSTDSSFSIRIDWVAKAVTDATASSSKYNENATQSINLTVRP